MNETDLPSVEFWRILDHLAAHGLIRVSWSSDGRSLNVFALDDWTEGRPDQHPPVMRSYSVCGGRINVSDSVSSLVTCLLSTGANFDTTRSNSINAAAGLLWDHLEDK